MPELQGKPVSDKLAIYSSDNQIIKVPSISLTGSALDKIQRLKLGKVKEDSNKSQADSLALRVRVDSGGCHGFQYHFDIEEKGAQQDDIVFALDGTQNTNGNHKSNNTLSPQVYIDAISYPFLHKAEIDYQDELIGSSFKVIHNPNSQSECGCHISFQAK
ncbi:hypothetical protein MIR68_005498 [Amoeboaphelidium protococcarum]|nr:hypothetical protein MIR68_005498 [Amoeboaphelidium protococcarum]KAI3654995.1 hypothetical protein MP228_000375 [Amoeboaphelidium protococcarum]